MSGNRHSGADTAHSMSEVSKCVYVNHKDLCVGGYTIHKGKSFRKTLLAIVTTATELGLHPTTENTHKVRAQILELKIPWRHPQESEAEASWKAPSGNDSDLKSQLRPNKESELCL